jgi:hypothetical protein
MIQDAQKKKRKKKEQNKIDLFDIASNLMDLTAKIKKLES